MEERVGVVMPGYDRTYTTRASVYVHLTSTNLFWSIPLINLSTLLFVIAVRPRSISNPKRIRQSIRRSCFGIQIHLIPYLLLLRVVLVTRDLSVLPLCLFHKTGKSVILDGGDGLGLNSHETSSPISRLQKDVRILIRVRLTLMATFMAPSYFSISSPILAKACSIKSMAAFLSVLVVLMT